MININLLLFIIIIKLIIYKYYNKSYILNFLLIFTYCFIITKNINISLFLSLIYLFISTIINYTEYNKNINNVLFILIIYIINYKINDIKNIKLKQIDLINFILLMYVSFSIVEWIIHKYIMHCNKHSYYYNLINKFDIFNVLNTTCDTHLSHHIEVNPNMHLLNKIKKKDSLYMGWDNVIYVFIITFTISIFINSLVNINLEYYKLIIFCLFMTILWCYIWNKVHPLMHNYKGKYSLKEGPYEEYINFEYVNKLLYNNHKKHHLQKGTKKGNFNIIFLGADEWFNTNVDIIDNTEYCKNPAVEHEEICKNIGI
jgi:hypothetical protein